MVEELKPLITVFTVIAAIGCSVAAVFIAIWIELLLHQYLTILILQIKKPSSMRFGWHKNSDILLEYNAEKGLSGKSRIAGALEVLCFEDVPNEKELKARYYELARKHHPDNGGSAERFEEINSAYNVITEMLEK